VRNQQVASRLRIVFSYPVNPSHLPGFQIQKFPAFLLSRFLFLSGMPCRIRITVWGENIHEGNTCQRIPRKECT